VAKRNGPRQAKVAVVRKVAPSMLRIWLDQTVFLHKGALFALWLDRAAEDRARLGFLANAAGVSPHSFGRLNT
jgi:hypothetical protein